MKEKYFESFKISKDAYFNMVLERYKSNPSNSSNRVELLEFIHDPTFLFSEGKINKIINIKSDFLLMDLIRRDDIKLNQGQIVKLIRDRREMVLRKMWYMAKYREEMTFLFKYHGVYLRKILVTYDQQIGKREYDGKKVISPEILVEEENKRKKRIKNSMFIELMLIIKAALAIGSVKIISNLFGGFDSSKYYPSLEKVKMTTEEYNKSMDRAPKIELLSEAMREHINNMKLEA